MLHPKFRLILISLYFKINKRMKEHEKSWPALVVPLSALITSLPHKRFRNKLALYGPNKMLENSPYWVLLHF